MAMSELLRRLMMVELHRADFHDAKYDPEQDSVFPTPQHPDLKMNDEGIIWKPVEPKYVLGERFQTKEEANAELRALVYGKLRPILDRARDMAYAWENAPALTHIEDSKSHKYRALSEHGHIVLAARDDGSRGLHFVTWEYSQDRKHVGQGHYSTSYEAAKADFATRSGLIREDALFEPEQRQQIYTALVFQGMNDDEMTYSQQSALREVIDKLERAYPELKELADQQERASETELEI